jgi:hypothetical protein
MRIDNDSFVLAECIAQDDVRGFSANSRKFDQGVHCIRDFTVVPLDESLPKPYQTLRLIAEESGAPDKLLEFLLLRVGKGLRGGIRLEQERRHHVDAFVRALSAQNGRHQQLEWSLVIQLDMRVGMRALEPRKNLRGVSAQ